MAKLIHKSNRRCRIQFTLSPELYDSNREIAAVAEELSVVVDYSRDFERWFKAQLEQVAAELSQLAQTRTSVVSAASKAAPVAAAPVPAAISTVVEEEDIDGDYHA